MKIKGKTLYRSHTDKVIGGVLGGLAEVLDTNSFIVRAIYIIFTLVTHFWLGAIIYIIALIVIPKSPVHEVKTSETE